MLKTLTALAVVLALAFPFLLALEKIHESDSFWHLKTGQWILAHGAVPRSDLYSSTVPGKPWLDWEWLFQAGMYLVYERGGFSALVVLKALLAALTGLLVFQACRSNQAGPLLAAMAVMLAFVACRERLEMRPDLVLLLFAAATVAILEAGRRGRPGWLWCLPVLEAVWVNCHASFPLGLFLLAAYLVGETAEAVASRYGDAAHPSETESRMRCVRLMLVVLVLTVLASLVNPYGIALIEHVVAQTRAASPAGTIGEWQSTRELLLVEPNWALRVFWWLFWLNPIVLIARLVIGRRKFPWAHALVVAGMSVLALRANRFTAIYAVVTAPILAGAAAQILKAMDRARASALLAWAAASVVGALAIFLNGVVVTNRWSAQENRGARFGLGVDDSTVPFQALDALNRLPVSLGLFNTFPSGGPLIWRSVPPWRVFTDGRANLYGREFVDQYRAAMRDPQRWETWMRERDISVVFLQYGTADDNVLLQYLAQSPGWSIHYFDQAACIFTRAGQTQAQVPWDDPDSAWKYAVDVANRVAGTDKYAWGRAMATMGNFLMVCGKVAAAERLFHEAVAVNPRVSEAWMNLGMIERDRRQFDRAMDMADRLLEQDPYYYPARLLRAEIMAERRDVDGAMTEVDAVLWQAPHSAQAWFKRAQLAVLQGDRDKAIRSLRHVVAEGVDDPTVYRFLATLLAAQGRNGEAIRAYEDCLRVWVGAPEKKAQVEVELQRLRTGRPTR